MCSEHVATTNGTESGLRLTRLGSLELYADECGALTIVGSVAGAPEEEMVQNRRLLDSAWRLLDSAWRSVVSATGVAPTPEGGAK